MEGEVGGEEEGAAAVKACPTVGDDGVGELLGVAED